MSLLQKLREHFKVNWTTFLAGWQGCGQFRALVSPDEITEYAYERLGTPRSSREEELISNLVYLNIPNEPKEQIEERLKALSETTGGDVFLERRKWRSVILEKELKHLPKDPVYGLIALTEFWAGFGYPQDSPHEVQGRGNTITPDQYYQSENFYRLLDDHHKWLKKETALLKQSNSEMEDKGSTGHYTLRGHE